MSEISDEMLEEQEFTCPRCGSHLFGTSGDEGECHGEISVSERGEGTLVAHCRFTWPRSEDSKVFKGTGRFHPKHAVGVEVRRPKGINAAVHLMQPADPDEGIETGSGTRPV